MDKGSLFDGKTKEAQLQATQLVSNGVEVKVVTGPSIAEEYRAVGRSVGGHILGKQHSKTVLVDDWLLVGSCNWTTSSRANLERDVLVQIHEDQIDAVHDDYDKNWACGKDVTLEELRKVTNVKPR